MQRAGDLELVDIDRRDRLRGEQRERIDADDDRGLERPAALLRHLEEHVGVARQQQHAEAVRAAQLAAVDRDVLLAGARIARDHQAGGDVGAAVVLVVGRKRQQPREIDLAMHDLLRRRRCRFPPRQRIERRVLEAREHLAPARRPSPQPSSRGRRRGRRPPGSDVRPGRGNSVARCPSSRLAMAASSNRRPTPGSSTTQPLARRQMVEPIPQRADRLRRVVAAISRGVADRLCGGLRHARIASYLSRCDGDCRHVSSPDGAANSPGTCGASSDEYRDA